MAPSRAASPLAFLLRSRRSSTTARSSPSTTRRAAPSCRYTARTRTHPSPNRRSPVPAVAGPPPLPPPPLARAPRIAATLPNAYPRLGTSLASPHYQRGAGVTAVAPRPQYTAGVRSYSSDAQAAAAESRAPDAGPAAPDFLDEKERAVFERLKAELAPTELEVQDISGGCGSMYAVSIASPRFGGLSVVRQHRLVNEVLADYIKDWHGLQLKTRAA